MVKVEIYLFVLIVTGVQGKVAVNIENLTDISNNEINTDIQTNKQPDIQDIISTTENATTVPSVTEQTKDVHEITDNSIDDSDRTEKTKIPQEEAERTEKTNIPQKVVASTEKTNIPQEDVANNTIDTDEEPFVPVDNGTALILTPLLEANKFEEARNACRVKPELFLDIESYSGFVTVNKTYDSNLFFWYFPIEKKPVNETPWIIWLQGGPGASSMTGLFDEIGPFFVDSDGTLIRNPYTWHRNHSLLFIDNPVGTGYSFTNHIDGYTVDMDTYASHLYSLVSQFVQIFPELRTAPLFIAGESYAGKYVPALAMQIHRHKDTPGGDINLQGLAIGNAYVDPAMILQMVRPFYYFGLLESQQIETVRPLLEAFQQDVAANRSVEAKQRWNHLITVLLLLTHQKHAYNFLRDDLALGRYIGFLRRSDVKRALHVGDIRYSFVNMTVNIKLNPDFLSNAKPLYEELLEHYRVLTYCGHLDLMMSCVLTSENYRTWKWNASQEFLESTRYPYIYNNRLSGYHKSGGGLTEAVLRGAGHMAPLDAPGATQHLLARWVRAEPLSHRFGLLAGSFVQEYIRNNSLIHYL